MWGWQGFEWQYLSSLLVGLQGAQRQGTGLESCGALLVLHNVAMFLQLGWTERREAMVADRNSTLACKVVKSLSEIPGSWKGRRFPFKYMLIVWEDVDLLVINLQRSLLTWTTLDFMAMCFEYHIPIATMKKSPDSLLTTGFIGLCLFPSLEKHGKVRTIPPPSYGSVRAEILKFTVPMRLNGTGKRKGLIFVKVSVAPITSYLSWVWNEKQ